MVRRSRFARIPKIQRFFQSEIPLPPHDLRLEVGSTSAEDFVATGQEFLRYFVDIAGLGPRESVLEIGCGCGRMAASLAPYLVAGRYEGFDIMPDAVAWCQQHITPRFPNFRFSLAELHSVRYSPNADASAATFPFPYGDASFDVALLTSVFTHLLPAAVDHYLAELARVLRPGGRVFATYFLVDDFARGGLADPAHPLQFPHSRPPVWLQDAAVPEAAVAYDLAWVAETHRNRDLPLVEPIRFGTWSGRDGGLSFQDIVLARRVA